MRPECHWLSQGRPKSPHLNTCPFAGLEITVRVPSFEPGVPGHQILLGVSMPLMILYQINHQVRMYPPTRTKTSKPELTLLTHFTIIHINQ